LSELQIIFDHLDRACCPEDVFGAGDDPLAVYRKLVHSCHPDLHNQDVLATEAFQKLNALRDEAKKRIGSGDYGKRTPMPHCTPLEIGKFKVKRKPIIGDIADLYFMEDAARIVKVARSDDDNDLMRAEAKALKLLDGISGPVRDGVPILAESFQIDGKRRREANVISAFTGFVTAQQVKSKTNVDYKTAVWMFKRILSLLTWVHHFGLVHGAILPPHVLFYPDNDGQNGVDSRKHSIRLIDWCYSVEYAGRTRLSSWVPAWKDYYAPELVAKQSVTPASDIYMAANLIGYLVDNGVSTSNMLNMPSQLRSVMLKCTEPDPAKRYQKASEAFDAWTAAAKATFGAPKWHEFEIPK
jgi:hypothetical protein